MTLQELEKVDIPEKYSDRVRRYIRAYLYFKTIEEDKRKALEHAGLEVYNVKRQFNTILENRKVLIFGERFIGKQLNDEQLTRKQLISQLSKVEGKDMIRAIDTIAKLKGYYDDKAGQLDRARPIYVVTGARRGRTATAEKTNGVSTT